MSTNDILASALEIIKQDIEKIQDLSAEETTLGKSEASKLTDYIRVLLLTDKKEREDSKSDSLESASQEEIETLALEAIKTLKIKNVGLV